MSIKWRDTKNEKPAHLERCLTKMKHGIIEGTWLEDEDCFEGYYFREMNWVAAQWVPIEDVDQ